MNKKPNYENNLNQNSNLNLNKQFNPYDNSIKQNNNFPNYHPNDPNQSFQKLQIPEK